MGGRVLQRVVRKRGVAGQRRGCGGERYRPVRAGGSMWRAGRRIHVACGGVDCWACSSACAGAEVGKRGGGGL